MLVSGGPTAAVVADPGARPHRLTPAERERMWRLRHPSDRDDFLAAHLLVRRCVADLLGVADDEVTIVARCEVCGGPHGRPQVVGRPEVTATLAHSHGVVAAAAAFVPVGVDVEAVPSGDDGLIAADLVGALAPAEVAMIDRAAEPVRALLRQWVRKEAFLKAGAVALDGFSSFDLSGLPPGEPTGPLVLRSSPHGPWTVHDWADDRGPAVGALVAPVGAPVKTAWVGNGRP